MSSSWIGIFLLASYVYTSHGKSLFDSGLLPTIMFESKSYYFAFNYKVNFYTAVHYCNILGMRLLTIPRQEVNDFLLTAIKDARKDAKFWTSGTRLIDGRNWVWISSARSIKYTNWLKTKPSHANDNQCIGIQLFNNKFLQWVDANCRELVLSVICESTNNLLVENRDNFDDISENAYVQVGSASLNIPMFSNNESSYYIGNIQTMSFYEANLFCKWIGLELVAIESQEENDFLDTIIRRSGSATKTPSNSCKRCSTNVKTAGSLYWTGGISFINKKHWYWLSTGKNVEYTNWAPGQPNQDNEHCFVVRFIYEEGLLWHDFVCDELKYFICETSPKRISGCPDTDPPTDEPNNNPNRPSPSEPGQNGPSQNGSSQNGSSQNGPGQNGSGQNGSGQNGSGQNGPGQNGPGQNGPGQNGPGQNEPNPNRPGENRPNPTRPNKKRPNPNPPASDYYIGKEKVTRHEAVKKCEELGLKLVSIQNEAKHKTISEVIDKSGFNTDFFWSSGHLVINKHTNSWYWLNGEIISKFKWKQESSNVTSDEECLSLKGNGHVCYWYRDPCSEEYYYICEPK